METNSSVRQFSQAYNAVFEWLLDSDPTTRWQTQRKLRTSFTSKQE